MPKKRKFIKKENAVNFYLMRRGQQDPLTVDENAPEHVLFPLHSKSNEAETQEDEKYEVVFDDDFEYLQRLEANSNDLKPTKTVQWDLVPVERNPQTKRQRKLKLPSSVFASEVEEKVGLLNKAAPDTGLNLDLDPDLVAAMADDFDYDNPDNELADDFMQFADKPGSDVEEEEEHTEESDDESQDFDSENDEVRSKFGNCDTKSYYSLVTCNPDQDRNLLYLEALYERTKEDYYNNDDDDTEKDKHTGADEERVLAMLLEDYEKSKIKVYLDKDQEAIDITKKMVENLASDEEYEEIVVHKKFVPQIRKPSTKNQPKLIEIPNDKPKKKPPRIIEESSDSEDSETESIASKISTLSIRPKNETPEERRERKHGIKGLRRIRREQKKENSLLFKEEKKRQVKLAVSQQNNQRMKRIN